MMITNDKMIQEEIKRNLTSANACYHSVQKLLSSHLLSKNIKIRIYKTIILPVFPYGCETWSLTLTHCGPLSKILRSLFQPLWDQPIKFYWLTYVRFVETVHCICFKFVGASCVLCYLRCLRINIRPMRSLSHLVWASRMPFVRVVELSTDESAISWKGRLRMWTYCIFLENFLLVRVVIESTSGYIGNLKIYSGEGEKITMSIKTIIITVR
jgi:hypothetical protein